MKRYQATINGFDIGLTSASAGLSEADAKLIQMVCL